MIFQPSSTPLLYYTSMVIPLNLYTTLTPLQIWVIYHNGQVDNSVDERTGIRQNIRCTRSTRNGHDDLIARPPSSTQFNSCSSKRMPNAVAIDEGTVYSTSSWKTFPVDDIIRPLLSRVAAHARYGIQIGNFIARTLAPFSLPSCILFIATFSLFPRVGLL